LDNVEQLQIIRDAHGDPALLALATVDLIFPDIPDTERFALRSALETAAVPHWCDAAILAKLIDDPDSLNPSQWARLKALPVVESFPARGTHAENVHEASRLAIRKRLAETERTRFIELSARLVRVFEADTRPIGRIEWIYHLLVADPERGAAELEDLDRTWSGTARHEDLAALSAVLTELHTSQLLRGKPSVRARLVMAQRRAGLTDASSLGGLANQLLQTAEATHDARLIGDAYALVGDAAQARGDLTAAEQAYTQYLAISEQLAARDPANTGWQRDLTVARSRVGDMTQARGDVDALREGGAFPITTMASPILAPPSAGRPGTTAVRPGHGLDGPEITSSWPAQPQVGDPESFEDFWQDDEDEEYTGLFGDREAEFERADSRSASAKRRIGRHRGGSNDHRLWLGLGGVVIVAAAAITGIIKFEFPSHSEPAHTMVTPTKIGAYARTVDLEHQADVAALKEKVIKMSSGQASRVVSAVYESGNSAADNTAQIIMFIGGHLADADPAASIASFMQTFPGAKVVSAGSLGGEAACAEERTAASGSVSVCAWFDNDSFGEIVSPTMSATALASAMQTVRPSVELMAKP
jgi:hypothetical protein